MTTPSWLQRRERPASCAVDRLLVDLVRIGAITECEVEEYRPKLITSPIKVEAIRKLLNDFFGHIMKKYLIIMLILATPVYGQTIQHYDKAGNPTTTDRVEGNRLVQRDKNGNQQGYWQKEGDDWVHRTKDGNLISRAKVKP